MALGKGYAVGPSPTKGVKLALIDEKPPFMTWEEIETIIKLHCDLLTLGVSCGALHAATLQIGCGPDQTRYWIDGTRQQPSRDRQDPRDDGTRRELQKRELNGRVFDAMSMDARGLPVIDVAKCTGCGICIAECPRSGSGLLELITDEGAVAVRCSSHDRPKERKAYCSMCCIACKKCEKVCPADAIHVIDLNAVVDYAKCTACGQCVAVCPQECIDITGRLALAPADTLDGCAAKVDGFVPLETPEPVGSGAAEDAL